MPMEKFNFNFNFNFNTTAPPAYFNMFNFNGMSQYWQNYNFQPVWFQPPNFNNYGFDTFSLSSSTVGSRPSLSSNQKISSYSGYRGLSKAQAEIEAQKNLEKLNPSSGRWSVCTNSFINDIPYARKGINAYLDDLTLRLNIKLTVTSALGTKNSPHRGSGHFDPENPKLDFGGNLSFVEAEDLKEKLDSTGDFVFVNIEKHGATAHLDVKIKDEVLAQYA